MKNPSLDELTAYQTHKSIIVRMEAFGDEFERVARTAKQGVLAERFKVAVSEIVSDRLLTVDFLEGMGEWLEDCGDGLEEVARTPEQKQLVASFREFIAEVKSPQVKEVFQRPLRNRLVEEIKAAMVEGSSNGVSYAELPQEGQKDFLAVAIDWTDYINRGLEIDGEKTALGIQRIIDNAIAGKPSEQWFGRTGPLAESYEDVLNRHANQMAKPSLK